MRRTVSVFLLFFLGFWLLGSSSGRAQDPEFQLLSVRFSLYDEWGRPYLVPRDTARFRIRLARGEEQLADLRSYRLVEASEVAYLVEPEEDEEDEGQIFYLVEDGSVSVDFVAFIDETRNPVVYRMELERLQDGRWLPEALLDPFYRAGESMGQELWSNSRAPNSTQEWAVLIGFAVIASLLIYLWFGRSLFARMLFNRQMAVGSAVSLSNLLVFLGLVSVIVVVVLLYLYPYVLWGDTYWIYVVGVGGYLLLLLLGYGLGLMMTKG